jgi:4-amino-4-deoxy-L-arabinose transferase-like glycosyltransferase
VIKMTKRLPNWLVELPVLLVGLAAFASLTLHQIDLPGLHTDEALEVLPAMQLLRGQEVECFKGVCLRLFGLHLPVMIYEYISTVNTYMAIPFFAVLGINVTALRAMPIFQSGVAIVFLYLLARELYGRRVALVALLLIAVNPSFVFWSRQGVFVTSVTIPISLAAVWAWLRWWRRGKSGYLYLGSFLFGLGVSAKFLFGWLIAGIVGAFVLLNLDRIANCIRQRSWAPLHLPLRWRDAAIGGLLFVAGLAPLIFFNAKTMSTINYIRANVFSSSYYNIDNANIGENLRERIKELRSVLNGETFWYLSIHSFASWRYPSVFLIAVGTLAFSMFGSAKRTLRQTVPTWLTVAAVVLPSYATLFFLPLHRSQWYIAITGIGLLVSLLSGGLLARGQGWRAWGRQLGIGMAAAVLFILFAYLAWKLAEWQVSWTVYIGAVLGLAVAPLLRAREEARRVLFPVLVIGVMLTASIFTPTALWFTHLAIITPWPVLAIAAIVDLVARRLQLDRLGLSRWPALAGRRWAATYSLGLLAVLALGAMLVHDDLEVDLAYHRELKIIGGKGDHTWASYRLAAYLQEHHVNKVMAMDWGIQDVVQFLSQGEINPDEIFGYDNQADVDPAFGVRVRDRLQDPQTVYVFRVQPHFLNRREAFEQIVAEEGKTPVEEAVIYDWSAIPIFSIVRVTG